MLVLPAELTQVHAARLSTTLQAQVESQNGPVVVDASALARFDSSALALLLQLRRDALAQNKAFAVQGLPSRLQGLAGLYGVAELLLQ